MRGYLQLKRTQIQLDEETYRLARTRAFEQGISVAALVREALHAHLGLVGSRPLRLDDFHFIGRGHGGRSPLGPISENHDAALAEDKRW